MYIRKTVALFDLPSNASKEELITVLIILKDVMVTIKHFIFFPNDDFCPNSLNQERNLNGYK